MDKKEEYFTPSIEDIRVGYEGEYQYKPNEWRWFKIEDSGELCDTWETEHGELYLMQMDKYKWLRVPYLTKEQIEKEGWKASEHFDKVFMKYDKEWCYGLWLLEDNKIHIGKSKPPKDGKDNNHPLYVGECKDINTFRYICKLLGI